MPASTAAFAAVEAIRAGEWDGHLFQLWQAVRDRRMILDPSKPPSIPLPAGQVWAWIHDRVHHEFGYVEDPPCGKWEPRGTGAVLS